MDRIFRLEEELRLLKEDNKRTLSVTEIKEKASIYSSDNEDAY